MPRNRHANDQTFSTLKTSSGGSFAPWVLLFLSYTLCSSLLSDCRAEIACLLIRRHFPSWVTRIELLQWQYGNCTAKTECRNILFWAEERTIMWACDSSNDICLLSFTSKMDLSKNLYQTVPSFPQVNSAASIYQQGWTGSSRLCWDFP